MAHLSKNTVPRRGIAFSHGEGAIFWDTGGRRYVDMSSQTLNALLGQRHPAVVNAVTALLDRYTFIDQDFESPDHLAAIDELSALLPPQLDTYNMRMNDGSSAVECAIKQARRATGRPRVMTVKGIYLGQNTQGIHFRGLGERPMDLLVGSSEDVVWAPIPYPDPTVPLDAADAENGNAAVRLIEANRGALAAVLLDPIMISSGVVGGRDMRRFLTRVVEAAKAYDIPVVFDECQTFGWVPDDTLAAHWDLDVDMLCLGKGVGGGLPLSVCAFRSKFDNLGFGDADYTNGGHPVSIAGLRATCGLLRDPAEKARFRRLADALHRRLAAEAGLREPWLRTRGVGLIAGIELLHGSTHEERGRFTAAVARRCLDEGIYVRPYANVLGIKPPRIIGEADLERGLDVIFDSIDALAANRLAGAAVLSAAG
jgi:4-aminobutyrate aminotransferase-like enzyme